MYLFCRKRQQEKEKEKKRKRREQGIVRGKDILENFSLIFLCLSPIVLATTHRSPSKEAEDEWYNCQHHMCGHWTGLPGPHDWRGLSSLTTVYSLKVSVQYIPTVVLPICACVMCCILCVRISAVLWSSVRGAMQPIEEQHLHFRFVVMAFNIPHSPSTHCHPVV